MGAKTAVGWLLLMTLLPWMAWPMTAHAAAAAVPGAPGAEAADVVQTPDPPLRPVPRRAHPRSPLPARATPLATSRWMLEDISATRRAQQLSFMLGSAFETLSVGLWYGVPLVAQGFLQEVNNAVYLEFGAQLATDFTLDSFLTLSGGLRWNFYLTTRWALFAALRANFNLGLQAASRSFYVLPGVSMGALYRLSRSSRLRLELGYPAGLGIGVAVQF